MAESAYNLDSEQEGYIPSDATVVDRATRSNPVELSRYYSVEVFLEELCARRGGARNPAKSHAKDGVADSKQDPFTFCLPLTAAATLSGERQTNKLRTPSPAIRGRSGGVTAPARGASGCPIPRSTSDDIEGKGKRPADTEAKEGGGDTAEGTEKSSDDFKGKEKPAAVSQQNFAKDDEKACGLSTRTSRPSHQRRRSNQFKARNAINRSSSEGHEGRVQEPEENLQSVPFWEDLDFDCELKDWVMEALDLECDACGALHAFLQSKHIVVPLARGPKRLEGEKRCCQLATVPNCTLALERGANGCSALETDNDDVGSLTFKLWRLATLSREDGCVCGCATRGNYDNSQKECPESVSDCSLVRYYRVLKDPWATVELGEERGLDWDVCDF